MSAALERLAALAACTLVAVAVSRRLLQPDVFSSDAFVHQYWMWSFRDEALFTDALTAELRESARYPDGYVLLFRLAAQVVSPIVFGEWLGVALMALSGWLVFLIVREHEPWRPAAWISAGLFLALIDIHRFHGGFPRAFVHPVVLLVVLLAMRRRDAAAAVVAAGGALLYPTAALLGCGVLAVAAVMRRDRRRAAFAVLALVGTFALVLLFAGGAPQVLTAAEARAYPEFGAHGPLHYFVPSAVEYLRQNRSGFDLRAAGSVLLLAAVALLLARRGNWRLLRAEVLAMPAVALLGYAAAQAVLFRLYLPHRYTYPLVAFLAIAVGVLLRPAWERRSFALLAVPVAAFVGGVYLFPLGPTEPFEVTTVAVLAALAVVVGIVLPAAGAAATGALLVAALLLVPGGWERGTPCPHGPSVQYLATLPKDAVIAGDPLDLKCLPATARRPVVISTQLAPSYEADYFRHGRARMFDMLRAYYGPSPEPIAALADRYGATHLWVRRAAVARELTERGTRWRRGQLPYGRFVRDVVRGGTPAVLDLPAACRRWSHGSDEVYDVACVAAAR